MRSLSLHAFLTRLIARCVLPLVLVAVFLAATHVLALQAQNEHQAADQASNLATGLDRNLKSRIAGLQMLAASPLLDDLSRLNEFHREAQGYLTSFGSHVVLADLSHQMILNTRVPLGTKLPRLPVPKGHSAVAEALAGGQPAVGDAFPGPIAKEPLVAMAVPVVREGRTTLVLLTIMETRQFRERLEQVAAPAQWSLSLVDGKGEVIAHRSPPGWDESRPDERSLRRFVVKSAVAPWSLVLEIPAHADDDSVKSVMLALLAAILVATLASVLAGRLAGRQLARSVAGLAENQPIAVGPAIMEIETVRRMLGDAQAAREAAEETRRRSERKFGQLFEVAPVPLGYVNRDGLLATVNQRFRQTFGYGPEETTNLETWWTLALPDAAQRAWVAGAWERGVRRAREIQADIEPMEHQVTCKDGRLLTVLASGALVGEDVLAVFVDITERKQAEVALAQNEELLRLAFENANAGMCLVDLEGRLSRVNAAFCRMFGYSADQLIGMKVNDLTHPDDQDASPKAMEEMISGRTESAVFEKRYFHRDGDMVWGQVSTSLMRDGKGKPMYFISQVMDITERKLAGDALRRSEERFAQITQLSREIVWEVDEKGLYTYVSAVAENVLGFSPQEIVGRKHFYDLHPEEGRREFTRAAFKVFEGRDTFQNLVNPAEAKDGRLVWLLTNGIPILDADGTLRGYRGSDSDISDRIAAERERARLEGQLIQAQKMEAIGTLAGGIAHDFNNILGAILGFAEIAAEDARAGKASASDIEEIIFASERARNLVRQILTFSRKVNFQRQSTNLNTAILQTLRMLEPTVPKMIGIESHLSPELDKVQADPIQMEQVILNLATNAKDAMPQGGRLTLETRNVVLDDAFCRRHSEVSPGAYVLLRISDNGQGMEPEVRDRIFDPFFTTKQPGKGTGLGLSTVYGIVKGHGGHIFCQSRPGQGTTFDIYLPPDSTEETKVEPADDPREDQAPGTGGILLVDDEEALRHLGAHTLTKAGYRVQTASSGEEALEKYRTMADAIDLVVMDLGMPGMGGHQALKAILELNPRAKIVIASGYAANEQVREALDSGAAGYVGKPFKRAELLATVRGVLKGG